MTDLDFAPMDFAPMPTAPDVPAEPTKEAPKGSYVCGTCMHLWIPDGPDDHRAAGIGCPKCSPMRWASRTDSDAGKAILANGVRNPDALVIIVERMPGSSTHWRAYVAPSRSPRMGFAAMGEGPGHPDTPGHALAKLGRDMVSMAERGKLTVPQLVRHQSGVVLPD